MSRIPQTALSKTFMETVGFTKIIELHPDILDEYGWKLQGIDRIQIMPDVNSLHVFWQERDNTYWHQIIDYPYPDEDESLENWLEQIADWTEGEVKGDDLTAIATQDGFYKWADHLGDYVTEKQLSAKYHELKASFRLLAILGV